MFNIIIDAGMTSDLIVGALKKTGDFRITTLTRDNRTNAAQLCREIRADAILLNVGLFPQHITLTERTAVIHGVRQSCPKCKIILLADEDIGDVLLGKITTLKQTGLIDAFIYADASPKYIVEMLRSICV